MLHTEGDHIGRHVAAVAVHDQETVEGRVIRAGRGVKDGTQPLKAVRIRCPATAAGREAPIPRRGGRNPGQIGVLGLEDDQRWEGLAGRVHAFNRCDSLLSA